MIIYRVIEVQEDGTMVSAWDVLVPVVFFLPFLKHVISFYDRDQAKLWVDNRVHHTEEWVQWREQYPWIRSHDKYTRKGLPW